MYIDLSGAWRLRPEFLDVTIDRFNEVLSREKGPFSMIPGPVLKFPSKTGFLTANVPCDVQIPLIEAGLLNEPFIGTGTDDCLWIKDYAWWFIREFTVDSDLFDHEAVRLCIGVLDVKADLILNGRPLPSHRNAFRPYEQDVKPFLKAGTNQLIIRLTCGLEDHYPYDTVSSYFGNGILEQKIYLRKPIFTLGWDWCKPVPTCGIGRYIGLLGLCGVRVRNWYAETKAIQEDGSARLKFHFELEKAELIASADALLTYDLYLDDQLVHHQEKTLYLAGGLNFVEDTCVIPEARLWWPNGYGDQPLYTVRINVSSCGQSNPFPDQLLGIRTLIVDQSPFPDGTRRFCIVVNGVRIFCKGGNWVPADSIYLRISDEKYKALIEEAKEQHFNMLRVWGGGQYEPDVFYDACSRNGILVMHDFMYACAYYPDHLDWFRHEAALEADYQTKRLAHHACMAIWSGNNEIHESYTDWFPQEVRPDYLFGTKIFNYIQPDIVNKNCPHIHYMPSSPYYGERANSLEAGDTHAWTFFERDPKTRFRFYYELEAFDRFAEKVRFSSEYGFHGALMPSSVLRYHAGSPLSFFGKIWIHHGEHPSKRERILKAIDRHLTDAAALDEWGYLLYSGLVQGILYDELATALRFRPHCSGNLIWMYNDCWPETGWSTVDYYLTRKISFYFLKRAYEPQKLMIRVLDGRLRIAAVNETEKPMRMPCAYGFMTFEGQKEAVHETVIDVPPHSRMDFSPEVVPAGKDDGFYFIYPIEPCSVRPAVSLRGYYRSFLFPESHVRRKASKQEGPDCLLTIESDVFTPFVQICCADDRTHMEDNYFFMLPGESRTVRVYQCSEIPEVRAIPVQAETSGP